MPGKQKRYSAKFKAKVALIIMVTSGYTLLPATRAPTYSATKAGLRSFTLALRRQLRGVGIRVVRVLPPLVDTPATRTVKRTPEKCSGGAGGQWQHLAWRRASCGQGSPAADDAYEFWLRRAQHAWLENHDAPPSVAPD